MRIDCPLPAALTPVPAQTCPFRFDQIVRLAFQRRQPASAPPFANLAAIQSLASWQTLLDANDDTKIVLSPIFAGFTIPSSEAQTTGGNDNSTFAGLPEYNGEGSVTCPGVFTNMAPAIKRAMDALTQETLPSSTGLSNLTTYLINRDGYIFEVNPVTAGGAVGTAYKGIDIYNFRLGSVGSEGFNSKNSNPFSFNMPPNWADYLTSVKPAFDPLTDLVPTA